MPDWLSLENTVKALTLLFAALGGVLGTLKFLDDRGGRRRAIAERWRLEGLPGPVFPEPGIAMVLRYEGTDLETFFLRDVRLRRPRGAKLAAGSFRNEIVDGRNRMGLYVNDPWSDALHPRRDLRLDYGYVGGSEPRTSSFPFGVRVRRSTMASRLEIVMTIEERSSSRRALSFRVRSQIIDWNATNAVVPS